MTGDSTSGSSRGANYLDVDAAFLEDEYQRSPIVIRAFGRDWEFPGVMPAIVPVRLARWSAAGKDLENLGLEETFLLMGDLIPLDVLSEWAVLGVDVVTPDPKVDRIVEHLIGVYFGRQADISGASDGPGEAPAPSTGPSDSSATGDSSKPTSDASTALSDSSAISGA